MTSRQTARTALNQANQHAAENPAGTTMALVGIGYALLDIADAVRQAAMIDESAVEDIETAGDQL